MSKKIEVLTSDLVKNKIQIRMNYSKHQSSSLMLSLEELKKLNNEIVLYLQNINKEA